LDPYLFGSRRGWQAEPSLSQNLATTVSTFGPELPNHQARERASNWTVLPQRQPLVFLKRRSRPAIIMSDNIRNIITFVVLAMLGLMCLLGLLFTRLNIYRKLGDASHLIAIALLILQLVKAKNARGNDSKDMFSFEHSLK
jgi:hypothetical protein